MIARKDELTNDLQVVIAALRAERDSALADKVALAEALATTTAELAARNSAYSERIAYHHLRTLLGIRRAPLIVWCELCRRGD